MGGGENALVNSMNGKELTASFWKGVKTARELKMLSSGWNPSTKQKARIRKVVVLCDAEYKRYLDGELDQPKIFLAEDKERLRYDTRRHAWNCLLIVGESSKDGILAGYLPKSDSLFLTYVPEHRELELPEGIPVAMEMGAASTNLQPALLGTADAAAHYSSFVGLELISMASSLHFAAYDPAANIFTVLEQGGPNDYMQYQGTPEEIAQAFHFSGKLKEAFFDLRYRNISHGSHLVKERQKRTYPKERSGDGR